MSRYVAFGWRISPKKVGVSASSLVVLRLLFLRCSRTPSTRFLTSGMCRISSDEASFSQRHQRSIAIDEFLERRETGG